MGNKLPPKEVEIEESIISSILIDADYRKQVFDSLNTDDFYVFAHKVIFEKCREMRTNGHPIEIQTVWAGLDNDQRKTIGAQHRLASYLDVPIATDIDYYISILKDQAARRRTIELVNAIQKRCDRKGSDLNKVVRDAKSIIEQIEDSTAGADKTPAYPPLTVENTRLRGVLQERPLEPDYILTFKGGGLFTRRVSGSLSAAGGTGKTTFFGNIAAMAATGTKWGYFEAPQPLSVLFLCAEETQDELDRRLWDACEGHFPDSLFAASIKGKVGPLMELKDNNPARSEWWHWLDQTIENHAGLDLLLLDPKSRLYGLSENDNDHNTAWVSCLEILTEKHDVAIWFAHHVPKGTKEISQWMGRGGGALIDACRTNMGMVPMTKEEGDYYGIKGYANYIKIAKNKINIGPKTIGDAYLKFDEKGRLHPTEPLKEKNEGQAMHLLFLLSEETENYSRRELEKEQKGKNIAEAMKDKFPRFKRGEDMQYAINLNLHDGLLKEEKFKAPGKGKPKTVLKVIGGKSGLLTEKNINGKTDQKQIFQN